MQYASKSNELTPPRAHVEAVWRKMGEVVRAIDRNDPKDHCVKELFDLAVEQTRMWADAAPSNYSFFQSMQKSDPMMWICLGPIAWNTTDWPDDLGKCLQHYGQDAKSIILYAKDQGARGSYLEAAERIKNCRNGLGDILNPDHGNDKSDGKNWKIQSEAAKLLGVKDSEITAAREAGKIGWRPNAANVEVYWPDAQEWKLTRKTRIKKAKAPSTSGVPSPSSIPTGSAVIRTWECATGCGWELPAAQKPTKCQKCNGKMTVKVAAIGTAANSPTY